MNDEDLRDLLAGLALIGLIQHFGSGVFHKQEVKRAALWSYDFADAMLEVKHGNKTIPQFVGEVPVEEVGIASIRKRKPKEKSDESSM